MASTGSGGQPAAVSPDPLAAASSFRIDRSSTAERVADVLRELITRGDLPAGTALREQQLVSSLDVWGQRGSDDEDELTHLMATAVAFAASGLTDPPVLRGG